MRWITFLVVFMVFSACSTEKPYLKKPEKQTEIPFPTQAMPERTPGTIWPGENGKNMLFIDNKARYVGDIVTIVVNEITEGTSKASTNTSRDSTTTAGIAALLGLDKSLQNSNENLKPKIELGGSTTNSLKGKGDTARGSRLQARLSARVVKVLENGNLVIEGRRQLAMNAEDQFLVIRGVIRPEDITSDNLVSSQYIADAQIYYVGEGVVSDKLKPGWLTRVVDWFWPF